jgi:DNA-directed RNA polymerase specialized sigma24 family protein
MGAMLIDLEQYTGLIVQLSLRYYRKVPPTCKRYLDPDDFVSMGTLRAWQVCPKWHKRRKIKFSTFLHTCLSNYFRDELAKLSAKRRLCLGEIVDPTDTYLPFNAWFGPFDSEKRVQKFLLLASPGLLEVFNKFLFNAPDKVHCRTVVKAVQPYQEELAYLRKVTQTTASDFRLILAGKPR